MLLSLSPCFVFHIFIVLILLWFQTSYKWGGFQVLGLEMEGGLYSGRTVLSFSLSLPSLFLSTIPKSHWVSWASLEVIVLLPEPTEWGDYSRVHSSALLSVNGGPQALLPCKHRVFLLPKLKFILQSWSYVLAFPHLSVFHRPGPSLASSPDQWFFVPIIRKMYY